MKREIFGVLLLSSLVSAACGVLMTNTTLIANETSVGTCFTIGAHNLELDCDGYSITCDNYSLDSFGIFSAQENTSIKNCFVKQCAFGIGLVSSNHSLISNVDVNLTDGSGYGIYIERSSDNVISNSRVDGDYIGIIFVTDSNNNILIDSIMGSNGYLGILITQGSSNNKIINSTGLSVSSTGISLDTNANNNMMINSTAISMGGLGVGLTVLSSTNNTIADSLITGNSSMYGSFGSLNLYLSVNNTFRNNTINGGGAEYAVTFLWGSNIGNVFENNHILNATTLVYLDADADSNTFYGNVFTDVGTYYVQDLNGSNSFNTSVGGIAQGNSYSDVLSYDICDTDSDGFGNAGLDYPYDAGEPKWSGLSSDWGPMTTKVCGGVIPPFYKNIDTSTGLGESTNLVFKGMSQFTAHVVDASLGSDYPSLLGAVIAIGLLALGAVYFYLYSKKTKSELRP